MARTRNPLARQFRATLKAIAADTPERTIAMGRPLPAAALAMLCWRLVSQPTPDGAASMALDVALAVPFGARSQSQAITNHRLVQVTRAPRVPGRRRGLWVGHTSR